MYRISLRFICLHLMILITIYLAGCSSSIPRKELPIVELKKEYDFASKDTITVFAYPPSQGKRYETFLRVLQLDLQCKGYKTINANKLLLDNNDLIKGNSYREIVDDLIAKEYLPQSDVILVARPIWQRVYLSSENVAKYYGEQKLESDRRMSVMRLSSYIALFDPKLSEPILSFIACDTTYLYSDEVSNKHIYSEKSWMLVAKQLTKGLKDIPICSIIDPSPAECQFSVSLWVDESYREKFPETWKDRLNLRVLFANDILRSQFNIVLKVSEYKEWDSRFGTELEETLEKLKSESSSNSDKFVLGITLDEKLKANWYEKSYIGLAYLLGEHAAITAQPSFPEVADYWNPIEEAFTLVHEVGHMLGAIHVPDESSIMYPTSGFLTYEFDHVNKKIIESTKNNFFNVANEQRVQNYIQTLITLNNTSAKNSIPILLPITHALSTLNSLDSLNYIESLDLDSLFSHTIADSILTLAIAGYIAFKYNHLYLAEDYFMEVIQYDPEFAEVHWYLSQVYSEIRDLRLADKHRRIVKRNRNLYMWMTDDNIKK